MVALGAFLEKTKLVRMTSVVLKSFEKVMDERHHASFRQTLRLSKLEPNSLENNVTALLRRMQGKTLNPIDLRQEKEGSWKRKKRRIFKRSGSAKRLRL